MPRHERSPVRDDDSDDQKAFENEFFLEGLDPSHREWASLPETTREPCRVQKRRRSLRKRS